MLSSLSIPIESGERGRFFVERSSYDLLRYGKERERFVSRRMVVKLGSRILRDGVSSGEVLNSRVMSSIASQCSELLSSGCEVIIVSSGAVACGRDIISQNNVRLVVDGVEQSVTNQVLASLGQPVLMEYWGRAFKEYYRLVTQFLLIDDDMHYMARIPLLAAARLGLVPIVNANDVVNVKELNRLKNFSDNDRLARVVAQSVEADTLVLLTGEKGVLDDDRKTVLDGLVLGVAGNGVSLEGKSDVGTGGMKSKVSEALSAVQSGITAVIGSPYSQDILTRVASRNFQNQDFTCFVAGR